MRWYRYQVSSFYIYKAKLACSKLSAPMERLLMQVKAQCTVYCAWAPLLGWTKENVQKREIETIGLKPSSASAQCVYPPQA